MKTAPILEHPLSEYFARMAMDAKNVQRLSKGQHAFRIETEIRRTIVHEIGALRPSCRAGVFVCLVRHIAQRDGLLWLSFEQYIDIEIAKIVVADYRAGKGAK